MILPLHTQVREARREAGLTQKQAARLVHLTEAAWQRFEVDPQEYGIQISAPIWELFLLKSTGMRPKNSPYTSTWSWTNQRKVPSAWRRKAI